MMYKFLMSVYKEMLLLKRDFGGLVILFVMPLVLIVTITLIQDSTFKSVTESRIPILLVDNDNGAISKTVKENLEESGSFEIVTKIDGILINEAVAKEAVFKGKYQLAIVIPAKLSSDLQLKVNQNVERIVGNLGMGEATTVPEKTAKIASKEVRLYFDPATQLAFKNAVKSAIDKMISQIETKSIYTAFQDQLGEGDEAIFEQESFIVFKEMMPKVNDKEVLPNSVQHNVPAWALFAIFFIVVPLSINIVKEKGQGTQIRLITNPVPYAVIIAGKTATYLIICMIQFFLMVAVGVYLFPYLGLPVLDVEGKLFLMSVVALFSGLAAIGFGILLGTIAKTQEQSAPFGATSVVILAAVGGVWVPVFAMPKIMQHISQISPMNWGLNAFYDVLLRNGNLLEILPEINLLLLFFIGTITLAIGYDKKKRAV
ncbi:ABC-2 type transport system permease protein [Flavobacterium arsenatis]|uniref:ABC-2 type transport system permease protein n=1 Tax=Flavobacterium arsenatis TaxID=1484332 RepID=A0ABU1TJC8_9FLAO|nr:ABC transporter permease [Flavobacterium arsenatis]MDR6966088.1 ABC-2 type transport system permease protein [Flavobacterium arsenatis]